MPELSTVTPPPAVVVIDPLRSIVLPVREMPEPVFVLRAPLKVAVSVEERREIAAAVIAARVASFTLLI